MHPPPKIEQKKIIFFSNKMAACKQDSHHIIIIIIIRHGGAHTEHTQIHTVYRAAASASALAANTHNNQNFVAARIF